MSTRVSRIWCVVTSYVIQSLTIFDTTSAFTHIKFQVSVFSSVSSYVTQTDADDSIFDCFLTSMAAIQEVIKKQHFCLFVILMPIVGSGWALYLLSMVMVEEHLILHLRLVVSSWCAGIHTGLVTVCI